MVRPIALRRRAARRASALGVLVAVGCGSHVRHPGRAVLAGNDVTLYRDVALVRQRVELDLPATPTTVTIHAAAGLDGLEVALVDRGGIDVTGIHVASKPEPVIVGEAGEVEPPESSASPPKIIDVDNGEVPAAEDTGSADGGSAAGSNAHPAAATEIRVDVKAPAAGHYAITLAYTTDRLHWDAAYTMTTTPARDHAVLHGALAIRNTTGIAFADVMIHVIDAELGGQRTRAAERLASSLVGGTQSTTPAATPREVGIATIGDGETRVELSGIETPRRMRAVLVYDPIGTKLDNPGATPVRDFTLGVTPSASTRITESFEVARDEKASAGLPAGPVRLLERHPDGGLGVLGESRLFDAATRVAEVDTIAVGTADGVVGHRERREITIDEGRRRLTEEFVISIDNARDHDVGVLIREHLYRGQNWVLAFESTKRPNKEGAQQISMRTDVRAKAQAKILYVVVYTWGQ